MTIQWLSIEAAAAALNVSARTVQRRIAAGKLPSRPGAGGRPEVQLSVPESASEASERQLAVVGVAIERADRLAEAFRGQLADVQHQAATAQRSARRGWATAATVAILGLAVLAGGATWAVRGLTRAEAESVNLAGQLATADDKAAETQAQADILRGRLSAAVQGRAQAEAQARATAEALAAERDRQARRMFNPLDSTTF